MRTPRIFLDQKLEENTLLIIEGNQAHYLGRSLRMRPQMPIIVFNGNGFEYLCTIIEIKRNAVHVQVEDILAGMPASPLKITLLQGISKGDRMDWVMQKSTELGVHAIQPVFSQFCDLKMDQKRLQKKHLHWQKIIQSAAEQCGRCDLPELLPSRTLQEALHLHDQSKTLYFHTEHSQQLHHVELAPPCHINVCIGPEGGFGPHDLDLLKQQSAQAISLGPRILRTETACVTALSLLQAQWGDFDE
ncbi:MAG: 16S rRNA (uracil(1498)-N(3))-methyltransferase [bacterium]